MNMSWKKTETPLNLIQILPSESDKPQTKVPHENPSNLRIQVGDTAPTVGSKFLSKTVNALRQGIQRIREICKASVSACQRTSMSAIHRLSSFVSELIGLIKKSVMWGVRTLQRWGSRIQWYFLKCWHGIIRRKNVRLDSHVHNISPAIETNVVETSRRLEQDELLWEVHALRDQLSSQKEELTRVTVQIAELKALSLSQQQVLLHLGKDLESIDSKHGKTEKAPPKKAKARSAKTSKSKPVPSSRPSSTEATMSLHPRR